MEMLEDVKHGVLPPCFEGFAAFVYPVALGHLLESCSHKHLSQLRV